jgi:hypothetical protein
MILLANPWISLELQVPNSYLVHDLHLSGVWLSAPACIYMVAATYPTIGLWRKSNGELAKQSRLFWRTAMVLKRLLVLSSFEEAEYASQELNFVSERGFVS